MEKRVAIQLAGLIRGFRFESVRDLFYERIIRQLELQGYAVDIFWHTYDIQFDDIVYSLDPSKFNVVKLVVDSDHDLQRYLQEEYKLLTHYKFHPYWEREVALSPASTGVLSHEISKDYLKYGWVKFLCSISRATKLRNEYEQRGPTASSYEWVITTSPQMEPQSDLDNLTVLDNAYMYSPKRYLCKGFYTSFYIGNAEHANYMGTFYRGVIDKTIGETLINSEPVFKRFVNKKYSIRTSLEISFNRIRYDGTRIDH